MISDSADASYRKPPLSPRPQSASPKPSLYPSLIDCEPPSSIRPPSASSQGSKRSSKPNEKSPKQRVRSASAGRSPRHDLQARYWALLFENLHRAVDEIYQTCETDESVAECKEAVLMLENYAQEFRSLIAWLRLSKDLEKTPPPNRPTSLAWEVRKSSPGKGALRNFFFNYVNSTCRKWPPNMNNSGKASPLISADIQTDSTSTKCETDCKEDSQSVQMNSNIESNNLPNLTNERKETDDLACAETDTLSDNNEPTGQKDPALLTEINQVLTLETEPPTKSTTQEEEHLTSNVSASDGSKVVTSPDDASNDETLEDVSKTENLQGETSIAADQEINSNEESLLKTAAEEEIPSDLSTGDDFKVNGVLDNDTLKNKESLEITSSENEATLKDDIDNKTGNEIISESEQNVDETISNGQKLEKQQSKENILPVTTNIQSVVSVANSSVVVTTPIVAVTATKPSSTTSTPASKTTPPVTSNSTGPVMKPVSTNKTTSSFTNATKYSASSSNRVGSNVARTSTNTYRSSYQARAPGEARGRGFTDRRGGFSGNTTRRGGPSYQHTSNRETERNKNFNPAKIPVGGGEGKLIKDHPKTGSTSSVSSTSSGQSWADKVKGTPPVDKSQANKLKKDDEDNEGWETVHRGRARSRASPIKSAPVASLSTSLTNLKEEDAVRRPPPVLRRVHTEINTFSARGSRANSSVATPTEPLRRLSATKPVTTAKNMPGRMPAKKDVPSTVKQTSAATKLKTQTNQRTQLHSRTDKSQNTKPTKDSVRKYAENKKPANESKPIVETKISENVKKFPGKEKDLSGNTKVDVVVPEIQTICEVVELLDSSIKEDVPLSDKELLLSAVQKEEELGSCEAISEDEIEIDFEQRKELGKDDGNDDDIYDDDLTREKILEEDEEDESAKDPLGDDTEEEMNTFDDSQLDFDEYRRLKIDQIHQMGLNWGEQMDLLDLEIRTPGRAPQMHEKLSSPFRKRSVTETLRRHEEKLAKAQEQRERLLEEKAQRFKDIAKKTEEIKKGKEEQQEQMRMSMRIKLQKAEEKRRMQLQRIVRKAHDEEEKVNEIAFINTLEAQNKRHDILSKEKDHELRLSEIQEERQRKQEEKAAKEAAAEERRKALEAERQTKLLEMQEKRKLRDQKIEQQLQEKEKERLELASQKARDREQRLNALSAAQQANVEELQKKIQLKLEESTRRHEENIELIRQKAFELSIRRYSSNSDEAPRLVPYETKKLCTLCNVLIASEVYLLSHLRGKKHQEAVKDQHQGMEPPTEALELYNIKHIVDAPADQIDPTIALDKERQKALKKRCKKIKQRLVTKSQEWEKQNSDKVPATNSVFKQKFQKSIRDLQRHLSALSSSSWESNIVTSLERLLGECERSLEKGQRQDKVLFQQMGGNTALLQMLQQILLRPSPDKTPQVIPDKTLVRAAVVFKLACINCPEVCMNTLFSNKVITLLDLIMNRLKDLVPDNRACLDNSAVNGSCNVAPVDPLTGALLAILATTLLRPFPSTCEPDLNARVHDVVGYAVSLGVVDKLSHYLGQVRGPLDGQLQVADLILNIVAFLTSLTVTLQGNRFDGVFECRKEDETQLLATLQVTELAGAVSLLYGMLLHSGAPSRGGNCLPPPMQPTSQALALSTLRMMNRIALLDYQMLQSVLGGEGLSLQLRHIASYLLWSCSTGECPQLLHEVVLLVGYFSLLHPDNQVVLQSGQCPSVLQQLCSLPFKYFSDPQLTDVLFPTLVACCFESKGNRLILEQEMSPELLANYIEASLLDIHQDSQAGRTEKKNEEQLRMAFGTRFPKNKWTAAKNFFQDRSATA